MENKNFESQLSEMLDRQIVQSYDKSSREVKINLSVNSLIKLLEKNNV